MPIVLEKTMTEETPDERMRRLLTGQFQKQLPRKFYKDVQISDINAILLDGRPVKTPMKNPLKLPTQKLAEAVAQEWIVQNKVIDPELMPLTKLANTALDRATAERQSVIDEIVAYAASDLVCYRADRPPELVHLQLEKWQPVVKWAESALQTQIKTTNSIVHVKQSEACLNAVRKHVEIFNPWQLTGVYLLMTLTGSTLLALMLKAKSAAPESVWSAAHVDEDYQISQWGEDNEAIARRKYRKREFDGLVQFLNMIE
jgi:chaperone required for assembly of F1-ATPase